MNKTWDIKRIVFFCCILVGMLAVFAAVLSFGSQHASADRPREAGEDIQGLYYMNITDNMTAIDMYFAFDVYTVKYDESPVSADEVRNQDDETKALAIETVQDKLNSTITNLINSAFPGDIFVITGSEVISSSLSASESAATDPLMFRYTGALYFTNASFNFQKPVKSLSEIIKGTLTMGATVNKTAKLRADAGFANNFTFTLPTPYRFSNEMGITEQEGKSFVYWVLDNKLNSTSMYQNHSLLFNARSPYPAVKEEIRVYTTMAIGNFASGVDINIKVDIRSINITKYSDMLPSTISNLTYMSSDGMRLMLDNNLTSKAEMESKSISSSKNKTESDLNNIFKNADKPVSLIFSWDDSYLPPYRTYNTAVMSNATPVISYMNTASQTGFSAESLKITIKDDTKSPDVHEIIMGVLRMGATVKKDFQLTAEANRAVMLNITAPSSPNNVWSVYLGGNISRSGSPSALGTNIGGDPTKISFSIDNMGGTADKKETVNLTLSPSSVCPDVDGRTSQDIRVWTTMNLKNFDDIQMNVTVRVAAVNITDYNIEIPGSVSGLGFVTSEFIRCAVKNGMATWEDITNGSSDSSADIEGSLSSVFSRPLSLQTSVDENSKLLAGGIDTDNMPGFATLSGIPAEILIILAPAVPSPAEPLQFNKTYMGMGNDTNSVHDLSVGVMKMGAGVSTDFDMEADKGTMMYIEIIAPQEIIPSGNLTLGNITASGATYNADATYRAVMWEIDNLANKTKKKGTINLDMVSSDPLNITSEDITIQATIDLNRLWMTLSLDIVIKAVDIQKYDIDVPSKVKNLRFITADGLRLAIDNKLTSEAEILDKVSGETGDVNEKISDAFGANVTLSFEWDVNTTQPSPLYDILDMGASRPAMRINGGATPAEIRKSMGSGGGTIDSETLIGLLNAGATAGISSESMTANYSMAVTLVLPTGVTIDDRSGLVRKATNVNGREAYDWVNPSAAGMSGTLKGTTASANASRGYNSDRTEALVNVDIARINLGKGLIPDLKKISADIDISISAEIYHVDKDTYGIELPENVSFDYINSDAIRLVLAKGIVSLDTLNESINKTKSDLTTQLRNAFNDQTINVTSEYDLTTFYGADGNYFYNLQDMTDNTPIRVRLHASFSMAIGGSSGSSDEASSGRISKQDFESAIRLIPMSFPLKLSGIIGWKATYRVILPEGIDITSPPDGAAATGSIGNRQYFDYVLDGVGATEVPQASITIGIAITPLFLLSVPLIRIILTIVIVFLVVFITYKVVFRRRIKEKKARKKMEKKRLKEMAQRHEKMKRDIEELKNIPPPKLKYKEEKKKKKKGKKGEIESDSGGDPDIEIAEPPKEGEDEFIQGDTPPGATKTK